MPLNENRMQLLLYLEVPKSLIYIARSLCLHELVVKMDIHFPLLFSIITVLLTTLPQSQGVEDEHYRACNITYNCGTLTSISYPFWGQNRPRYCGSNDALELSCDKYGNTLIQIASQTFTVILINQNTNVMRMALRNPNPSSCPSNFTITSLNPTEFYYLPQTETMTVFIHCSVNVTNYLLPAFKFENNFTCKNESGRDEQAFYVNETQLQIYGDLLQFCDVRVQLPVLRDVAVGNEGGIKAFTNVLDRGFDVRYVGDFSHCSACFDSEGICGSRTSNVSQFSCHCRDGTQDFVCSSPNHGNPPNVIDPVTKGNPPNVIDPVTQGNHTKMRYKVIIYIICGIVGVLFICIAICCLAHKWLKKSWMMSKRDDNIEAFVREHEALARKRYKFSEVKKMTNSFKIKLGQGGFGAVYKGELPTVGSVAVKLLNESKRNGEEFINEVASISETSHVNIVTLRGFCIEGKNRALVYEYMPNGSLEKHIYQKGGEANSVLNVLSWEKLHHIAVGIAQGLEYLHKGCKIKILHFDIKPHNILLDENFYPKISDFGLAKLCPSRESIISMSDTRGTPSYRAPELTNKNLGGVSHKSDVYSYGMMLLEMVGGRKNLDAEVSRSSEVYYPHWVYNNLEMGNTVVLRGVTTTEESEIAKKMILVGLWCIQTIPTDRPAISRVIEMLEGSIKSLQKPPKPVLAAESFTA